MTETVAYVSFENEKIDCQFNDYMTVSCCIKFLYQYLKHWLLWRTILIVQLEFYNTSTAVLMMCNGAIFVQISFQKLPEIYYS